MRWLKLALATALIALAGVVAAVGPADASTQSDFIAKLVPGAQENERRTGIPASVTIGMAALETGWGRSSMTGNMTIDGKVYVVNTLFNIKCTSTVSPFQTGCVPVPSYEYRADGSKYLEVSNFRTYASWDDSMLDYGRLLTSLSRYAPAFQYTAYPDRFVQEVRKGGYATDPRYAELVISIMRSYDLYQYNVSGADAGLPPGSVVEGPVVDPNFEQGSDYPEFSMGSRGLGVETLQGLLNATNRAGLIVDGSYGTLTQAAVKAYQTKVGLKATGSMNDATWAKLLPALKAGDKGELVTVLQRELKGAGIELDATGNYASLTEAAVLEFQALHRLKPTGEVGPVTWARLLS